MSTANKKRSASSQIAAAEVKKAAPARVSSRSTVAEFNPDYSYVKKDLLRIATLAGSFIVIMVVISFFVK
jgi:hypothetical protein